MPNLHFGLEGFAPLLLYLAMWTAFAASIFWRPAVGVYLLALTLPLQTGRYRLFDLPLGSHFLDILLLGTIIGLKLKNEDVIPRSPVNGLLLLFAIYCYLSLWQGSLFMSAPLPIDLADPRLSDWKNYVEMFLFAPVVAAALKDRRQVTWLLVTICLSMLVVNRSYYSLMSERNLAHFNYDVRDDGLVGYAGVNGLAALEVMFSAFMLGMYCHVTSLRARLAILVLLATSAYCLLFSFSRGGYVAMLAVLLVIGILRKRSLLVLLLALLVSWQTVLPTAVQERILMTTGDAQEGAMLDSSAQERLSLWQDAFDLLKQNPVTGTGFHTYEYLGRVGPYRDTHNYYVKVLVETGFVGLLMFLWLLLRLARMGLRLFRTAQDGFWSGVGLGFFALVCGAVVVNFFGDRWTYQQIDGVIWVLLGCVIRGQMLVDAAPGSAPLS
ncbi:MAG: O-antigen ligase family protein [Pseudomonadota bacterium]|nr:O-antigen ligase family protein [Pseudomonadota bacterium]